MDMDGSDGVTPELMEATHVVGPTSDEMEVDKCSNANMQRQVEGTSSILGMSWV